MPSYLLQTVFPVVGVFLSNALYFAPAPAVYAAAHTGALGSLNVLPQAVMVLSTFAWMFYALSVPNLYIALANLPGAVAAVWYAVATLPLIPRERASERASVQAVLVGGAAVSLCLWMWIVFSGLEADRRSFYLGLYGSLLCVALFASPLSTVRTVLKTGSAATIYAPLTMAQCINCGTWTLYGLAVGDVWVWGPNGTGFGLGLVQVLLKLCYPSRREAEQLSMSVTRGVSGTKQTASDEEDCDDSTSGLMMHAA